jgi:hypothetical protein
MRTIVYGVAVTGSWKEERVIEVAVELIELAKLYVFAPKGRYAILLF